MITDLRKLKPDISMLRTLRGLWRQHPINDRCQGYWLLNETGGLVAYDVAQNKFHGTYTAAPLVASGKYGRCFLGDGANQKIDVGNVFNIGANIPLTISFWINCSDTSQDQNFVDKRANLGWQVRFTTGGGFFLRLDDAVGVIDTVLSATVLNGTWHHILAGRDTANFIQADGGTRNTTALKSGDLTDTVGLVLGGAVAFGAEELTNGINGRMDLIRIWDRVLTQPEKETLIYDPFADFRWASEQQPVFYSIPPAPSGNASAVYYRRLMGA